MAHVRAYCASWHDSCIIWHITNFHFEVGYLKIKAIIYMALNIVIHIKDNMLILTK